MGAGYDAVVTRKRNCGDESDDVTKVRDRVIGWHILKNTIKNANLQKKMSVGANWWGENCTLNLVLKSKNLKCRLR